MVNLAKKVIKLCFSTINIDIRRIPEFEKNKFKWLRSLNINTIIDVGANAGQFVLEIRKILPDAKIYSFEPIKDVYEKLLERCDVINNFQSFNMALGSFNGNTKIYKNKFSPSSSILEMNNLHKEAFPYTREIHDEEFIVIRKLDDLIIEKTLKLEPEILIKLDVQGYEDNVIRGGMGAFKKIKAVIIEVSYYELYKGQVLFDEIYDQLIKMGYRYKGNIGITYHPQNGLPLFADSIFIKET